MIPPFCLIASVIAGGTSASGQLTAEVKPYAESPALLVNGEPIVPMVFWGHGTQGGAKVVTLEPEWREFSLTFVAPEDNDGSMGVHIRFGGGPPGTVWVDDVQLYRGGKQEAPQANMLRFGDWEATKAEVEQTWTLFQREDEGADVDWDVDGDEAFSGRQSCRVTLRGGGKSFMHAHIYQSGMSVAKGETYTYSLRMKSTETRQVDFQALHHGPPWTIYSQAGNEPPAITMQRRTALAPLLVLLLLFFLLELLFLLRELGLVRLYGALLVLIFSHGPKIPRHAV